MNYSKAFDTVPHQELLFKLWGYAITGSLWSWFRAYLSSRIDFVIINGTSSHTLEVTTGVPQGSKLGPLLFILCVNDIPTYISTAFTSIFGDETKRLPLKLDKSEAELQEDINFLVDGASNGKFH